MTTSKTQKNRLIPRKLMQNGIDLCKQNIYDFLNDARSIVAQGRLNHAYILVEFAIEEFGKIVMLKEALKSGIGDLVAVNEDVFTKHNQKSEKAWTVLDSKYRTIFDEGCWEEGVWERGVFQQNTEASHKTRCECAFVDFTGSQWILGQDIKKDLLQDLIAHIGNMTKKV
jgi:AbiV family abortive infection protein